MLGQNFLGILHPNPIYHLLYQIIDSMGGLCKWGRSIKIVNSLEVPRISETSFHWIWEYPS